MAPPRLSNEEFADALMRRSWDSKDPSPNAMIRVPQRSNFQISYTAPFGGGSQKILALSQLRSSSERVNIVSPEKESKYLDQIQYTQANPMAISGLKIKCASDDCLDGLVIKAIRETPFGLSQSNEVTANSFKNSTDFQQDRVELPFACKLDASGYIVITNGVLASGVDELVVLTFFVVDRDEAVDRVNLPAPDASGNVPTMVLGSPSSRDR